MNDVRTWLESLKCPDCQNSVLKADQEKILCASCNRTFEPSQGIWNFLPAAVSHREGKEKEKQGWQQRFEDEKKSGWDPPPELFLQLPYYPYPYYEEAARYMEIVLQYAGPWAGKRFLELGAAECWATRHFTQAGCESAALDYDPSRMIKAQVILDSLPINFLRLMGDGECLPFKDKTFDCIFCCSVLHHFFDFPKAVREIARTLKPGGMFLAIHEAFHPPYFSKEKILHIHADTPLNLSYGINEQSFTAGYYRKIFRDAGMKLDLLNPNWDTRLENGNLIVKPGVGICHDPHYVPEWLRHLGEQKGLIGKIARVLLRSKLWRIAAHPRIFPLIRFQLLNWTRKAKIIAAKKPPFFGAAITDRLRIRARIRTQDQGYIEGVWKKTGEGFTANRGQIIRGYFYASPNDVSWGSENNPELFVKIGFDPEGRSDINFFHASVPGIEVFSEYAGSGSQKTMTDITNRYIRHCYKNAAENKAESKPSEIPEESPEMRRSAKIPFLLHDNIRASAVIHTAERGPVKALWCPGGEGKTRRGDQVIWGYFYADPSAGGSPENPDLFVKIWCDAYGRTDVNFFHASVSNIEVFSANAAYHQKGMISVVNRYIRHEYR